METKARDEELLEDIAAYFDILASDSEECARRGFGSKRENLARARCWKDAATTVRSIKLV